MQWECKPPSRVNSRILVETTDMIFLAYPHELNTLRTLLETHTEPILLKSHENRLFHFGKERHQTILVNETDNIRRITHAIPTRFDFDDIRLNKKLTARLALRKVGK